MERVQWTDERLDERMKAIDETFDRIFHELHELRVEVNAMRADLSAFQRHVTLILAGQAVALIGVLGADKF